jgi:hypothetical protein
MAKMKVRILSVTVACLLATTAWADEPRAGAAAEESSSTLVGERVRLSGPSLATRDEPLIGQVVAVDAEAITVVKDKRTGETIRIPFASIKRLDVARHGQGSRAGTGLLIGALIPLAAGLAMAAGEGPHAGGDMGITNSAVTLVAGVPLGALLGAAIGSQSHTQIDRWERVDTRRRVRVSVLPDLRGGVRGGLSVRF